MLGQAGLFFFNMLSLGLLPAIPAQEGHGPCLQAQRAAAASPEWRINASVLAVRPLKVL